VIRKGYSKFMCIPEAQVPHAKKARLHGCAIGGNSGRNFCYFN